MIGFNKKKLTEVPPDIDLSTLDRETNTRNLIGIPQVLITAYLACFTFFQIYASIAGTIPTQILRMSHLAFVIPLCYWMYPVTSNSRRDKMNFLDLMLGFVFLGIAVYYLLNFENLIERVGAYSTIDLILGGLGLLLVMEACRRVVGLPIVIIATVFLLYALFGNYLPGFINHRGYSVNRIISQMFYSTEGIIGMPIGVCATFVFLFVLFGAFLEKTGVGKFFIDICNAIAGSASGGPAKVAVLASALEGTISGSSISNVVTSGSFTIPLMKSLGYSKDFAGAVEAAASTGGQIMPPIMGAAAFLMAEMIGVDYFDVAKAATVPAVLYFTGVYIMVHFEAKKLGLRGLPKDQLPKTGKVLKEYGHLILPLIAIMAFLLMGFTATRAALWGILASIIVPFVRKNTVVPISEIASAVIIGAKNMLGVSCACAVAGIIVGVVTMTGLGLKLGEGLLGLTDGLMFPTLVFTMITSLVLGMGVPTTANYLITSIIAAPIIVKLGVPVMAAHLFAFYFGILSDITPPVALAAYAGAAISKGNPFRTGIIASKLAVAAFIVPFIFVYSPQMLLIDVTFLGFIQILVTSVIGMIGIGAAMTGYFLTYVPLYQRILLAVGGLLLIDPGVVTDILGILIVGAISFHQYRISKCTVTEAPINITAE